MQYRRVIFSYLPVNRRNYRVLAFFFLIFVTAGLLIQPVSADEQDKDNLDSGPDVAILDATVKMDISSFEEIPLGTIPDERLVVTITVKNTGNREAPGYKLRSFLVRVGREDEIGTQLGGEITDVRLGAGETRTYSKTSTLPTHLKKGQYRVMVILDTSNYFIEPDTDNNKLLSQNTISPGSFSGAEGSIPVYSPVEITEPGYYTLKRDIDGGNAVNIFKIKSSGVTFDGGGNTIRGLSSGFTTGVYVDGGAAVRDVVIKNLVLENMDAGVWLYKSSNGKIENCVFRNIVNMGLRLDQSHQNEISGNTFEHNSMGLGVFESKDNIIYNNLFKNEHNAVANDNLKNQWNTDLKSGTNIIGGSMIGGNAWFDESGEAGFSAMTQDYTNDGISDSPYSINQNNIDLHPLTISTVKSALVPTLQPQETPDEVMNESLVLEEELKWKESSAPVNITKLSEPQPTENMTEPSPEIPVHDQGSEQEITPTQEETTLSPYADIGVKKISGPESACAGYEFNLTAIIENSGGYDADRFQVRYYLTEDKKVSPDDTLLGERTMKDLLSGSEKEIRESFMIPELIGLKNYYIAVIVNTDNSVFEDKKVNNTGYSSERMAIRKC